jgi:hypothetical protein
MIKKMKRTASAKAQSAKKRQYGDGYDNFYTNEQVILNAVARIKQLCADNALTIKTALDFSAGDGAFLRCMSSAIALDAGEQYDTEPRSPSVTSKDWFDVAPHHVDFVGFNPPFGYQSKLTKRFLAHAAEFSPALICCVHLFMRKNIFPAGYKLVHQEDLAPESFYNPASHSALSVPGCKISYLLRDDSNQQAAITQSADAAPALPPGFTKIKRERPWNLFTQGLAVRRTGVNAGRQVFVWFGKNNGGAILIDQRGAQTSLPAIQQTNGKSLSPQPFATYECASRPPLELGVRLWNTLRQRLASRQQAIVPTLDVPFITSALVSAFDPRTVI